VPRLEIKTSIVAATLAIAFAQPAEMFALAASSQYRLGK
jgi:hypothetical protein